MNADDFYTDVLEPLLQALNRRKPDFEKLRGALPPATGKKTAKPSLRVEDFMSVRGSLDVAGAVVLEPRAMLVVLGDLTAAGLYAPRLDYTAVVVGGRLRVARAYTSGDVIAFGGVEATDTWWGVDNDYSAYAPQLKTKRRIAAFGRHDVARVVARADISGHDVTAKIRASLPDVDVESEDSIRAWCGVRPARKTKAKETPAVQRDAIARELAAAMAIRKRTEKVAALRAVYARIKKGKLADLGDLVVAQLLRQAKTKDWSLQDELELLASLGRADLLEALPKKALRGYAGWIPGLVERARR